MGIPTKPRKPGRPKNNERRSARLRATERVAELAGVEYDIKRYPYGGFFDTFQLEKIAELLESHHRLASTSLKK